MFQDKSLTREDVERLLREVGSSAQLDLRNRNLRGIILSYVDLSYADLRGVDLSYANLSYATLRSANLFTADLRGANLRGVDLSYADLRGVDLSYADLSGVDLDHANLRGAEVAQEQLQRAQSLKGTTMPEDPKALLDPMPDGKGYSLAEPSRDISAENVGAMSLSVLKEVASQGTRQYRVKPLLKSFHIVSKVVLMLSGIVTHKGLVRGWREAGNELLREGKNAGYNSVLEITFFLSSAIVIFDKVCWQFNPLIPRDASILLRSILVTLGVILATIGASLVFFLLKLIRGQASGQIRANWRFGPLKLIRWLLEDSQLFDPYPLTFAGLLMGINRRGWSWIVVLVYIAITVTVFLASLFPPLLGQLASGDVVDRAATSILIGSLFILFIVLMLACVLQMLEVWRNGNRFRVILITAVILLFLAGFILLTYPYIRGQWVAYIFVITLIAASIALCVMTPLLESGESP